MFLYRDGLYCLRLSGSGGFGGLVAAQGVVADGVFPRVDGAAGEGKGVAGLRGSADGEVEAALLVAAARKVVEGRGVGGRGGCAVQRKLEETRALGDGLRRDEGDGGLGVGVASGVAEVCHGDGVGSGFGGGDGAGSGVEGGGSQHVGQVEVHVVQAGVAIVFYGDRDFDLGHAVGERECHGFGGGGHGFFFCPEQVAGDVVGVGGLVGGYGEGVASAEGVAFVIGCVGVEVGGGLRVGVCRRGGGGHGAAGVGHLIVSLRGEGGAAVGGGEYACLVADGEGAALQSRGSGAGGE